MARGRGTRFHWPAKAVEPVICHRVTENIIHQDNQAAIFLEKNGKTSSGKRTKHISMRFFFVTDRITKRNISVGWCPTGDMTGDFLMKPTQGALFCRFRDQIMGVVAQPDPGPGKSKKVSKPKSESCLLYTSPSPRDLSTSRMPSSA